MERYDIAIIGTGPAGVSAALTAKNRNKSILLLGSRQMSEKVAKAHEIRNYPGLPLVKGEDLAAAFREQLPLRMSLPARTNRRHRPDSPPRFFRRSRPRTAATPKGASRP